MNYFSYDDKIRVRIIDELSENRLSTKAAHTSLNAHQLECFHIEVEKGGSSQGLRLLGSQHNHEQVLLNSDFLMEIFAFGDSVSQVEALEDSEQSLAKVQINYSSSP